ncbi:cytochrome b/b6 domain-containing protein [Rhizobium sp. TH2]|uniref:cytochrome b n=1 Tax=Rhizobium sp. TH2 TaxID=2775403 RepID=UPI0021582756|nr:cytochrome b/b6 domain-containing protein [Rhizobium sp. TH2]UVC06860.1 cytochrome b/b6 domain-containing protein [Rhizobium sp. TH2]
MRDRYTNLQIALHWAIVLMIPIQYLTGGSIDRTHHAVHMGIEPSAWDILQHKVHNYCGMAIGALMALRLIVRLRSERTAFPSDVMGVVALALHWAFYAAIICQAALGLVASYLTFRVAPLHVAGAWIILGMVALHVAAAFWHALVKRDDVLERMLPRKN